MKVRLKDLGTIFTGNTPSKRVDEYWDNSDIKFIKPDIIKDELCVISSANEYISAGAKNASRIVPANSVLVTCIGNIGRVGITEEEVAFNQQINAIVPNRTIIPKYLAYAIYANRKQLQAIANAPVVPIINKTQFSDFEISICESLEKQNKIVRILDTISEIITHNKKKIEALDDLIKARFVEMFGTREKWNDANWKITSIDEIIEKPKSGEWGQKDESGRGIGVIRTTNFSDRGAVYFNSITTRDIPREKLITKGIKNGDILIEKSGGSDKKPVGRVVLYTGESNKYLNNNFTAILRINNNTEVNNIFLFTFLYINYWQGGTKVFESKTTGIHNLNLKEFLNKTKIAIPDMLLQNQFATFVAQVDKSKFALSNELAMGNFYIRLIHDCIMHGCIDL